MSLAPYPGLRSFTRGETDIFFGRQKHVYQLVDRLAKARFLSVVGPSGCGKSSLVRAGLLDALEIGFMAGAGGGWHIAEMRPGNHPMQRLAEALIPLTRRERYENDVTFLQATLERGQESLSEFFQTLPIPSDDNLLVMVDQFEEIFRFTQWTSEADQFVALLLAAARQRAFPIYIVTTMRWDFIGDCTRFPGLPEAINDAQFLTPKLTREQSREAVEAPAHVFDGTLEPPLVNRLLNDMGDDPDQLPLMQHVLMRLWTQEYESKKDDQPLVLTLKSYELAGSLSQALSNHAEDAYNELTSQQQRIAEVMFRRLSERGAENRDMRRPTPLEEVAEVADVSIETVKPVIEAFRRPDRSFITPKVGKDLHADTILDISHESFIRQWQRLRQWVEAEADSAASYRHLEQTTLRWKENKAALWSTPDLENYVKWREEEKPNPDWAQRYGSHFTEAKEFLDTSETEHQAKLIRKEKERQHELDKARQRLKEQTKTARKFRRLSLLLGFIALIAIAAGILAWQQSKMATREQNRATAALVKADEAKKEAEIRQREAEAAQLSEEKARRSLEREKQLAVTARDEAEAHQKTAEKALKEAKALQAIAEEQRQKAFTEAKRADAEKEKALQATAEAKKQARLAEENRIAFEKATQSALKNAQEAIAAKQRIEESKKETEAIIENVKNSIKGKNDAWGHVIIGQIYQLLGEDELAKQAFNAAIDLNPELSWAYNKRGFAYFLKKDYKRAIEDFSHAIELDSKYALPYKNRGDAYLEQQDNAQAIKDYTRAINLDPKYAAAYNNRGRGYFEQKDYTRAIEDYNRAIELDPEYASAYNNRGIAYSEQKDYSRAINDYTRVIELDPNEALAYFNRGSAYREQKDYTRAIENYNRAIELDPKEALAYFNRGNAYFRQKDYTRAIEDYNRAIELDPKEAWAYNNRGIAYSSQKDYTRAIENYNRAIELDPKDALAYNNRGIAYYEQKDYTRAIENYNRAIELDPEYALTYNNRGIIYYEQKDYTRAIEDYNRAIELDPKDAWAYGNLGNVYYGAVFDFENSFEMFNKRLALEPDNFNFKAEFCEANLVTNRWAEASDLAEDLLQQEIEQIEPYHQIALRFIKGAAFMFQGKIADGKAELRTLIEYYQTLSDNFSSGWNYRGTRHYIENSSLDDSQHSSSFLTKNYKLASLTFSPIS